MASDLLHRPVPPGNRLQRRHHLRFEALTNHPGRVAADDAVGWDIGHHHRSRRHDGTIADLHAGHDHGVIANPDIIANHRITFVRQIIERRHHLFPTVAENLEWIGRYAGHLVIGAIHDELHATCDGAESADDQFVANERKVIENVALEVL